MRINLEKAKGLKDKVDIKKKVDQAHKSIHRKSLVSTRRHIIGRADSIKSLSTRRLVFSWTAKFLIILVLGLLSYSKLSSAGRFPGFTSGGDVVAGIWDENENINLNPLTLSSPAENSIGRLIYSSPLRYDELGVLKGDLAETYSIEDSGKKFKFKIRENAKWHDGKDLNSEDVVFTITKLKDSRVKSSLRDSLGGVEVAAIDSRTVEISSPKAVGGLDDLMTKIRIAPKHIFEGVSSDNIATVNYNRLPVGSGVFEVAGDLTSSEKATLGLTGSGNFQQISLTPNKSYYGNSAQTNVTFRIFSTREDLAEAFDNGSIGMYIGTGDQSDVNEDAEEIKLKLSSGVFSFFNTKSPALADARVRRALSGYIDRKALSEMNGGIRALYSPILGVGENEAGMMSQDDAKKLIAEAGWIFNAERGVFSKDGQDLKLNLVTGNSDEYSRAADEITRKWKEIGVDFEVFRAEDSDLQGNYFVNKTYDILLYGISLSQATEPYAYWSSDAASPRGLNFSNYRSPASDADLDVARTKLNVAERNIRLERFVKRWNEDVPAASLYVPSLKVVYRSSSMQPDPNQQAYISGFTDAFDLFTQIKAQKMKLYRS